MGEFLGPEETRRYYTSKFLRVGGSIYTSAIEDTNTPHRVLGEQNGIDKIIEEMRVSDPSQVDGGQYSREGKGIRIHRDSSDFKIPVKGSGAREATVQLFQAKSPGFTVTADEHFEYPK